MEGADGISAYRGQSPSFAASDVSVGALALQVRQDQMQLNDWTTCVSAKTPKGQAAIQKLSGEISGAKEQIARAQQSLSGASSAAAPALGASVPNRPGPVDIWA